MHDKNFFFFCQTFFVIVPRNCRSPFLKFRPTKLVLSILVQKTKACETLKNSKNALYNVVKPRQKHQLLLLKEDTCYKTGCTNQMSGICSRFFSNVLTKMGANFALHVIQLTEQGNVQQLPARGVLHTKC